MLANTYNAYAGHLFVLKYHIFFSKCFVVTPSLCGNVTIARFLRLHQQYFGKIFRKKADEAWMSKWFKACWETDAVLARLFLVSWSRIFIPKNVPWLYIHPSV